MQSFAKIAEGLNTEPLRLALARHPELFGMHPQRRMAPGTPHGEMTDVWVRYFDYRPFEESGDWSGISKPGVCMWYPEADVIPEVKPIVFDVMRAVEGEILAGVLITKLPPGGKIARHTDGGWHASMHHKFFVPIQTAPGAKFSFEDGDIEASNGDLYLFRNDVPHWVTNDSGQDRIALIIAIGYNGSIA